MEKMTRICIHCGKPMDHGMTDLVGFYSHEECFESEMNKECPNGWGAYEDGEPHENDEFYYELDENGNRVDTGIFYTEWFDEEMI